MRRFALLSIAAALAFGAASCASNSSPRVNNAAYAKTDCYNTLQRSQYFSWGRVGIAATIPEEAHAFNGLLERPDARAAFKSLWAKENSTTTRLWALSGLYFADHDAFAKGAEELRKSSDEVGIIRGCIASDTTMSQVVWSREGDVLVLDDPATAVDDLAKSTNGTELDIAHGGIPAAIRSMKEESPSPCAPASQSSASPQH